MKKVFIAVLAAIGLVACQPSSRELSYDFRLPKELNHCEIHKLSNGKMTVLYVVHCPNATTTTSFDANGKGHYVHTTLVSE